MPVCGKYYLLDNGDLKGQNKVLAKEVFMKKDFVIYKKALTLALPMMIQNGITNAVGLVDNIMVGSLGTESITAVSVVSQLFFVFNLAVFGGLSGPGIYGAQYYGSGNNKGVQTIFRLKLWIASVIALGGYLVFKFFGENLILLYLRGESATIDPVFTMSEAMDYLGIMLIGIIPFVIFNVYSSSLRETGDSFKPMVAGVAAVLTDVVLNYILIFGKLGAPAMGVRGAALATALSRYVEFLVIIIWAHLAKKDHAFLKGIYSTIFVSLKEAIPVLKNGAPIFLNEFFWSMGIAAQTQAFSLRGLDVVAGLNISNALCNMLNVVFVSLGVATGILIGQILGSGDFNKAKKYSGKLTVFSAIISAGLGLIVIIIAPFFPMIYNTTDTVRHLATYFMIITAVFFPVSGVLNAMYFTIRSGGKTFITFLFDGVFTCFISAPLAYLLCIFTGFDILTVLFLVWLADSIKIGVGYVLLKKGVWLARIVEES